MLDNETSFLLEQLNCESISYDHQHHRHIESEKWAEDEKHSIVDNALAGLGHYVLVVDDSLGRET